MRRRKGRHCVMVVVAGEDEGEGEGRRERTDEGEAGVASQHLPTAVLQFSQFCPTWSKLRLGLGQLPIGRWKTSG